MSQNRPWVPAFRVVESLRRKPLKLTVQKLVDGVYVTTATASELEAAERHAAAVGGRVQCLDAHGNIVALWEGE